MKKNVTARPSPIPGGEINMRGAGKCSVSTCEELAVTSFAEQDLCLNHFVSRCYEDLDRLDNRGRKPRASDSEMTSLRSFAKECSQKALEVSLRCEHLDNLQRSRLLDILLWAGELLPEDANGEFSFEAPGC
jgi:hypothetical protein